MLNNLDYMHALLFKSSASVHEVIVFFLVNFGLSCLIVYALLQFVTLEINKRKRAFSIFLISIATFIPLLGNLASIIIVLLLKKYSKDFHPIEMNLFPPVEYTRKKAVQRVSYGTSWANVRLQSSNFTEEERKKALLSVTRGVPRDANLIYSQLVSDDMEELRICAFSMLENQQDYLQSHINQLLKKFHATIDTDMRAFIAKQIALLYWEIVYRNLSDREFRAISLERSHYYTDLALQHRGKDMTLWVLLARINNESGKFKEVKECLAIASKFDAPSSKILPYLAELAYENREFPAVKRYLCSDSSLLYVFKIHKIVKFWCQL